MTVLRILNVMFWLGVMVYMASGAWAAASGRGVRRGDPMRLACFITGFVFALGFGRLLLWPESMLATYAVYSLALCDAAYMIALGRSYGRGERL